MRHGACGRAIWVMGLCNFDNNPCLDAIERVMSLGVFLTGENLSTVYVVHDDLEQLLFEIAACSARSPIFKVLLVASKIRREMSQCDHNFI